MSIQDEINRINQNIAKTYSALGDMGATLPQEQNSANMASAVRTIPQSGGGGDNSTFIVNAIGTVIADFEKSIIMVEQITSVDKTVAEIMEAALSGKSVRLCLDVSASLKELFIEIMGLPAETEITAILYFDLTILTSIMDVIFSAIIDFTGSGIPIVTRIQGTLDDLWGCTSVPLYPQS